jgi:hypothetical protein
MSGVIAEVVNSVYAKKSLIELFVLVGKELRVACQGKGVVGVLVVDIYECVVTEGNQSPIVLNIGGLFIQSSFFAHKASSEQGDQHHNR